jgi:hypothetical protein
MNLVPKAQSMYKQRKLCKVLCITPHCLGDQKMWSDPEHAVSSVKPICSQGDSLTIPIVGYMPSRQQQSGMRAASYTTYPAVSQPIQTSII